ncbi:MAG: RNA-binding S4 domain-containing protein [Pseudoclavibacter sp.]|nr:RNA-binding S4 domain-containing protein [Pseudoclavibacter sp.]
MSGTTPTSVRIDAWLWAVRAFKTRSAATAACRAGHVRINDETVKASSPVRVGDLVRIRVDGFDRVLEVTALAVKRGSAQAARERMIDRSPPRPAVPRIAVRDRGAGRPTKRERREIDRLRGRESSG